MNTSNQPTIKRQASMGNFDGLTDDGAKYRLKAPYSPYDICYETTVSPDNRDEIQGAIRDVQALLSQATDILVKHKIPPCMAVLGSWEDPETAEPIMKHKIGGFDNIKPVIKGEPLGSVQIYESNP